MSVSILQERLQEALQTVKLGMDEVERMRDECLKEMKVAVSQCDNVRHLSSSSDDVYITVQVDDRTREILQKYGEAQRQLLEFIGVKHAIKKALL